MKTKIELLKEPELESPILIEGLPGIGHVGRIAADYLVDELHAKKFAELHSPHFPPCVIVDKEVRMLRCEFYYWKNPGKPDLVFLLGDAQVSGRQTSYDAHYEFAESIVKFLEKLGVKRIMTLGGFARAELKGKKPRVIGAVSKGKLLHEYKGYGIDFKAAESLHHIIGASGLLLGIGERRGIDGICLLGETTGFPVLTDPRAAEAVLEVLRRILDLDIDLTKVDEKVKQMEKLLVKIKKAHREEEPAKHLKYIG